MKDIFQTRKGKKNEFPLSSFYFLHQHSKTGKQISWRLEDSEVLALSHTWVGQGDGRKMWYAHAHTYIYTPSEHISNIIQHMDRASIHIMTSIQIMYYTHTHTDFNAIPEEYELAHKCTSELGRLF